MRAREFLPEAKVQKKPPDHDLNPTVGLNLYDGGEDWTSDYMQYRLGLAVAGTDGQIEPLTTASSWIGKRKTTNPYTPEEQQMLKMAYKAVGAKYKDLNNGDMKSRELDDTNSVSPVAKFKPTKRKS
jgi:hypothetical protein